MRQPDPHQPRPPRRPLTIRQKIDRELRPIATTKLLRGRPLPTRRFEDVSRGRTSPARCDVEIALDARRYADATPDDVRAYLHASAAVKAAAVEDALREAA